MMEASQTLESLTTQKHLSILPIRLWISLHVWLSKTDKPMYPDRMIFDLDPGEKTNFDTVKKYALIIKKMLAERGITTFALLTGSKGIHVIAPLARNYTFDKVHHYAYSFVQKLVKKYPQDLTLELRKDKRQDKLFIDYLRNTYGATSIAPYAVRPLAGAPIATPVAWPELHDKKLTPQTYTIRNIHERLARKKDVWPDFHETHNTLKVAKAPRSPSAKLKSSNQ